MTKAPSQGRPRLTGRRKGSVATSAAARHAFFRRTVATSDAAPAARHHFGSSSRAKRIGTPKLAPEKLTMIA